MMRSLTFDYDKMYIVDFSVDYKFTVKDYIDQSWEKSRVLSYASV